MERTRHISKCVFLAVFLLCFSINVYASVEPVPTPDCTLATIDTKRVDDDVLGDEGVTLPTFCLSVSLVDRWQARFDDLGHLKVPGSRRFDVEVHWDTQNIEDLEGEFVLAIFSGELNDSIRMRENSIDILAGSYTFESLWLIDSTPYFFAMYKKSPYCFTETNCSSNEDVQELWFESGDLQPLYLTLPPQEWAYFTLLPKEAEYSSVVFLPGVQGSRLYIKEGDSFDKVWEPSGNSAIQKLHIDDSGESVEDIYVGSAIDKISIPLIPFSLGDVHHSFFSFLDELERENVVFEAKPLSYDWRFTPKEIATMTSKRIDGETKSLRNQILHIANNSPTGKVTIIAHSYGGIVAKEVIKSLGSNKVDAFVTLGTPHYGTPKAIYTILHGEGLQQGLGFIMNKSIGREFAISTDSAYILVPFPKYFDLVGDPVISIQDGEMSNYLFTTYGDVISNHRDFKDFFQSTQNRSTPTSNDTHIPADISPRGLLDTTQSILENFSVISDVRYISFAGWGLDTIKGARYYTRRKSLCIINCYRLDYRPVFTQDGDGTVVTVSAEGGGGSLDEVYYLDFFKYAKDKLGGFEHLNMTEFPPLQTALERIIEGGEVDTGKYVLEDKPTPQDLSRRLILSAHSPVEIQVVDIDGNTTGRQPLEGTDFFQIAEDIPGSFYMEFGDGKYIGVDFDDIESVILTGIGSGESTIEISDMYGGESTAFTSIPTATSSVMTLYISDFLPASALVVDYDGDGDEDVFYFVVEGETLSEKFTVVEEVEEKVESIGGGGTLFSPTVLPEARVLGDSFSELQSLDLSMHDLVTQSDIFLNSLPSEIPQEYIDELSTLLDDIERALIRYTEIYE